MKEYDHKKIEKKWQNVWEKKKIYKTLDNSKKKKFYSLIEFPYPSGDGLHVGHIRSNTAMDIISRKRRGEGYNVLYPIGWDAFGLPTENYAIKTGIAPALVTKKNTDTFRRQLKSLGFSFDWSREINTTDPKYYKWTQWMFLQFLKHDLAYKAKININWCPKDKIGLANEEVVNGCCERCGTQVEKKEKEQWMLRITKYAEKLDKDLDDVDFLEKIKLQQRNWIGKSMGAEIDFEIKNFTQKIKIFTTRPDTIYGATFIALAPQLARKLTGEDFGIKVDTDRENKEKIGVDTGLKAKNPANGEMIPVFAVNYVSHDYGTGAVMGVPAHDERDFEFAKKYNLPIRKVIEANFGDKDLRPEKPSIRGIPLSDHLVLQYDFYPGEGFLINSGKFNGLSTEKAKKEIVKFVGGKEKVTFKLRDWVFSRQRYWGEPIPVVHCIVCGIVPLPDKELPLKLPKVVKYQPTDNGESPLASVTKWVNTKCPKCKGKAKRETDTMPNWAGSSWYFLRYIDPKNNKNFADEKKLKYFMPVDWYNGGMEHTTLHLLYSRFWNKFLYDIGIVPTSEPYQKRTSHGLILAKGGEKMSKSKGNVINPDEIVKVYGADTLRLYEMFMGPFDQAIEWSTEAIIGPRRFLEKVWKIASRIQKNSAVLPASGLRHGQNFSESALHNKTSLTTLLNKTIKKVSEDIENMRFNTAVSSMMILATEMERLGNVSKDNYKKFLQILAPFAPHITEELWVLMGEKKSINLSAWPKWDEEMIKDNEVKIIIQINGKLRGDIMIGVDETEDDVKKKALENENIIRNTENKEIKRVIYVKGRLVNIVI